jgi:hypothetical protein
MRPSEQLTTEQAAQLQELIMQYSDAFSMGLHDLPPLLVEPMQIRLKPGTTPIRQKLRKEPMAAKDFVREQIMQLADGGIVRPSRSPWLQPIMVAAKKPPDKFRLQSRAMTAWHSRGTRKPTQLSSMRTFGVRWLVSYRRRRRTQVIKFMFVE